MSLVERSFLTLSQGGCPTLVNTTDQSNTYNGCESNNWRIIIVIQCHQITKEVFTKIQVLRIAIAYQRSLQRSLITRTEGQKTSQNTYLYYGGNLVFCEY